MSGAGRTPPDGEYTLESARAASSADRLDRWVFGFLASPGSDNADLADQLGRQDLRWVGPCRLRISELHRLAGPSDGRTLGTFDEDDLETVQDMAESVEGGWDLPPAVVTFNDRQLVVEDGNHRLESLRREGEEHCWCVVGVRDREELAELRSRTSTEDCASGAGTGALDPYPGPG